MEAWGFREGRFHCHPEFPREHSSTGDGATAGVEACPPSPSACMPPPLYGPRPALMVQATHSLVAMAPGQCLSSLPWVLNNHIWKLLLLKQPSVHLDDDSPNVMRVLAETPPQWFPVVTAETSPDSTSPGPLPSAPPPGLPVTFSRGPASPQPWSLISQCPQVALLPLACQEGPSCLRGL